MVRSCVIVKLHWLINDKFELDHRLSSWMHNVGYKEIHNTCDIIDKQKSALFGNDNSIT